MKITCQTIKFAIVYPETTTVPADNEFTELHGRGEVSVQQSGGYENGTLFYDHTVQFQFTEDQLTDKNTLNNQHFLLKITDDQNNEYTLGTLKSGSIDYNPVQLQTIRNERGLIYLTAFHQSENNAL